MLTNDELFKIHKYIYKFIFLNGTTHRNIIRKKLIMRGKVRNKSKFFESLDGLLSSGCLKMDKEMVSINPEIIKYGIIKKERKGCFIVEANSNRRYKVERNDVAGYKNGEVIEIVVEKVNNKLEAVVLGKTEKENTFIFESSESYNDNHCNNINNNEKPKVENNKNVLLGRVVKTSHDNLVFIPNSKSFPLRQIQILNSKEETIKYQDKICTIEMQDMNAPILGGTLLEIKGDAGNLIHEYDAIASNYGAVMSWSGEQIEDEISRIPTSVYVDDYELISENEAQYGQKGKVVDLRDLPFVTVDPATCKDMDDAIYSRFDYKGNIVCYTAVANVTKYFNLKSEIGKRYIDGAFTIYAPNKAYSILPSQLSTGICSLNPNEDRLAFVVKSVIDFETGKVKKSEIYDAIIKSRKKFSYEEAQEIVDNEKNVHSKSKLLKKCLRNERLSANEQMLMNYYAGETIKTGFEARKMLRFIANKEREIIFDDSLENVVDIKATPHLMYHEIIEAFMVTANEATAKYAKDNNLDNIFRIHNEPSCNKGKRANEFFKILGLNFNGDLSAEGTRRLIEIIKDTDNEEVINKFLIKMQSRAVYNDNLYDSKMNEKLIGVDGQRISHYALQSPHYSHTTSPIRRLPDYITQYNILANIHQTKPISSKTIKQIVEIANERQLDVDQAEKDFEDVNSVLYCEKHIGEKLRGRIVKFKTHICEDENDDNIIVIVKDEEKGVCAEIPLSQIVGRSCKGYELSQQRCAVYDKNGKTILSLCKPINFVIEKVDRKAMRVTGMTNKEIMSSNIKQERQENPVNHQEVIYYVEKQNNKPLMPVSECGYEF